MASSQETREVEVRAELDGPPFVQGPGESRQGASGSSKYLLEVGALNRHWYRRCLDSLDSLMREASRNLGIEELQELCGAIVTSYLTAVTAQAPDARQQQFPCDRGYFIPFDGDVSESCTAVKSYFQFPVDPPGFSKDFSQSLWSFYPVKPDCEVAIDASSVSGGRTISFEEMISFYQAFRGQDDRDEIHLRKSLLIKKFQDVRSVFTGDSEDEERFGALLERSILDALVAVFQIYRRVPGQSAIELLLLHQVHLLSWLDQVRRRGGSTLSQSEDEFNHLFETFVAAFFLAPSGRGKKRQVELLNDLVRWVEGRSDPADLKTTESELAERLRRQRRTPFLKELELVAGFQVARGRQKAADRSQQRRLEQLLRELRPDLTSFRKYFLDPKVETRLDEDLRASLDRGDSLRAGQVDKSQVWICQDFADLNLSLPLEQQVDSQLAEELAPLLERARRPLILFHRRFETRLLRDPAVAEALDAYWRTRGNATRESKIYASYRDPAAGLATPRGFDLKVGVQNVFVRVRVCDSLNEPILNGVFLFSCDRDEIRSGVKEARERAEDIQDLLAFSKVFFFIVRDYFHGQDRARDASDIGSLNKHLFDSQLSHLDARLGRILDDHALAKRDLLAAKNWHRMVYELLNTYAGSLISQPREVRRESFPFDRLLVFPLNSPLEKRGKVSDFDLPFFCFQSLFVERVGLKIDGGHYSLLKPFQSPVEVIEGKAASRFGARSFQQLSTDRSGRPVALERYLEKHFADDSDLEGVGRSFVTRSIGGKTTDDYGNVWSRWVLRRFWERLSEDQQGLKAPELIRGRPATYWRPFLRGLTAEYRAIQLGKVGSSRVAEAELWFLARFSLLQALLRYLDEAELLEGDRFGIIRAQYRLDLKLLFDADPRFDVFSAALDPRRAPFEIIRRANRELALAQDPLEELAFSFRSVGSQDPFYLEFLQQLTLQVRNDPRSTESGAERCLTFFQPALTRPLEDPENDDSLLTHRLVGRSIGRRLPPYEEVASGEDSLQTFLAVINLQFGDTDRGRRDLRALLVLIRDYDSIRSDRVPSETVARDQLRVDQEDLSLFTKNFVANAEKKIATALRGQRLRLLSNEINQVGRSWYTRGLDLISGDLRSSLGTLVLQSDPSRLQSLQPQLAKTFFNALIKVLLGPERGYDGQLLPLESFPFDRCLHVPINQSTGLISYARTSITGGDWGGPGTYDLIRRRGRVWDVKGGRKCLAVARHLLPEENATKLSPSAGRQDLLACLEALSEPKSLDRLTRTLYEANRLQSLAVAGLAARLEGAFAGGHEVAKSEFGLRMSSIVQDSLRSLERSREHQPVITQVYMARSLDLSPWVDASLGPGEGKLATPSSLPCFHEFFMALEDDEQAAYGLGPGITSKVFFVFYSIATPETLTDAVADGGRYRGVFCFILDDESTDDKRSGASETLSDAELADREDIRTLMHNSLRCLKNTLELQSLEGRLLQPGVEQFVLGILHRLKNELGIPLLALGAVRRAVSAAEGEIADFRPTVEGLEGTLGLAEATITGIKDLFKNLKSLSDVGGHSVPLQNFDTHWLASLFLTALCDAVSTALEGDGVTPSAAPAEVVQSIRRVGKKGRRWLDRGAEANALLRVQRELVGLRDLLEAFGPAKDLHLSLFVEVHSSGPLVFRASHLVEEAFRILIENAFQALWQFISEQASVGEPIEARLGITCHVPRDARDEVCVEISNSTLPIPRELLEDQLNAETPQPISTQQHSTLSGKRGGSGFGHYYARRIVSNYCGGVERRKNLDVRVTQQPSERLAKVSVNLLAPSPPRWRTLSMGELQTAVELHFGQSENPGWGAVQQGEGQERQCYFPAELEPTVLARLILQILSYDRERSLESFLSILGDHLCSEIKFQIDVLRRELLGSLKDLAETMEGHETREAIRRFSERTNRGSLRDLELAVTDHEKLLRAALERAEEKGGVSPRASSIVSGRGLEVGDLVDESCLAYCLEKLCNSSTTLRQDLQLGDELLNLVELDDEGVPAPSKRAVSELMAEQQVEYTVQRADGQATIEFVYWDATPSAEERRTDFRETPTQLADRYRNELVGRSFEQYQEVFNRLCTPGAGTAGGLSFGRFEPQDSGDEWVSHRRIRLVLQVVT